MSNWRVVISVFSVVYACSLVMAQPMLLHATRSQNGSLRLQLTNSAQPNGFVILQSTSNFVSWQRVGPLEWETGDGETTEPVSNGNQFFRTSLETPGAIVEFLSTQALDLAQLWLDHRNKVQGIEQVGGPFSLSAYTNTTKAYTNLSILETSVSPRDRQYQIGKASGFQIWASRPESSSENALPIHFGFLSPPDLSDPELQALKD